MKQPLRNLKYFIYLPIFTTFIQIISFSNFSMDDWGQLGNGIGLREQISDWTDLWAFRPISWIAIPTLVHLLRDNYVLLSIVHLAIISYSLVEISNWRLLTFNTRQKLLARYLLFAPAIASSMFLSPINQLSASLSLLFFALALQIEKKNLSPLLESTLIPAFFIFSLLSYEITAPLILTYYLVNSLRARKRGLIFEAVCVFVIFVAWQKIVAPILFLSDFSRIRTFNPGAGISLFFSTGVSFPLSLLTALFDPGKFLYILLFCGFLFLVCRKHSNVVTSRSNKSISLALFAGIASSSLLFFIAGAYSQINGYQNRGMSGTWVLISLLIATRYELSGKVGKILIILVVSTNFLVFSGKVFESIEASKAREKVVTQVSDYLTASGDTAPVVFLDMPCITPADEYKTEVFCTSWDALGALRARGISLSNVSPIGDPAFVGNWESSDIPDGSLHFKFDKQFVLKDVSRAMPDDFEFRTGLFATSNRYLLEIENRKLSCKALARNIILASFQLDWAEVVRCASDPFT